MTSHQPTNQESGPKTKLVGLLAEFEQQSSLLSAANHVREAGYKKTDAYSPFPVHGLDPALGIPRTKLPFMVLATGIGAACFAVFLQWYANAAAESPVWPGYDYIIGGKPYWSLPANIPVVFEITVLLSAFAAFFGMWGLNKLPQYANPLHRIARFQRATSDRFFIMIEAEDEKFDRERTENELNDWGASAVEVVEEDLTDQELPSWLRPVGICALCLLLIPPVLILRARGMTNSMPRLHVNPDMDWQFKSKAQNVSPSLDGEEGEYLFADGRVMRPPIPGTIARGELEDDDSYFRGIVPGGSPVNLDDTTFASTSAPGSGTQDADPNEPEWVMAFPPEVEISMETLERGKEKFNIYCAVCHGYAGDGDGLVSQRGLELSAVGKAAWTQARNLHDEEIESQPIGRLFDTITNGRSTMAGYKSQLSVEDRWAVVLYVRALQEAEYSSVDDVPDDLRNDIPEPTKIGFESEDDQADED